MDELFDVVDDEFMLIPPVKISPVDVVIEPWALDCMNELFEDYWDRQTEEQTNSIPLVLQEIETSFPEFKRFNKLRYLKERPVLCSVRSTAWFVFDKLNDEYFSRLLGASQNFSAGDKKGSILYMHQFFGHNRISYTDKGSLNIFGPTSFEQLKYFLAAFMTELCRVVNKMLPNASFSVFPLKVDNTIFKSVQEKRHIDIGAVCERLVSAKIRHSVNNGAITVYMFPKTYDGCVLRIFSSGCVLCMGTAPRAVKSIAFHFADQLVANSLEVG